MATTQFDFTLVRANAGGVVGPLAGEFLDMSLDGKRIRLYDLQKDTPQGGGTAADRHPTKVHVTAGPHEVGSGVHLQDRDSRTMTSTSTGSAPRSPRACKASTSLRT